MLAGCTSRPSTPEQARVASDGDLCLSLHGATENPVIVDEVTRRELMSENEWLLIRQGLINVGVSACAVRAAFGVPHRIKRETFGETLKELWIYDDNHYVFIRNGKVASFAFQPEPQDLPVEQQGEES